MRRPLRCARRRRRASGAGIAALSGRVNPSASTIDAIVDAVPMGLQCPALRVITDSVARNSSWLNVPARTSSLMRHMSVADPRARPRCRPVSIGPPVTISAGRSTDAAPITIAGVVLSQPDSRTTPSIGLPLIDSSTSMAIRLRNSIVVGWICVSPRDMTGNSSGTPPDSQTPRLTCSANSSRCWLHGVSSEAELQMPIIGRPVNASSGRPRFIQLRWMKLSRLVPSYQRAVRRCTGVPSLAISGPRRGL